MNVIIVVAPHFVAGLLVNDDDKVIQAAPILGYMRGWEGDRVRAYVHLKGWRASRVVNAVDATVDDAVGVTAMEAFTVNQPNPNTNPNDPNNPRDPGYPGNNPAQSPPGAPHTPEAPRQNPRPDDGGRNEEEA